MYYTKDQLSKINSLRSASQGVKYYCTDGTIYIGLYSKRLKLFTDPNIQSSSVIQQIDDQQVTTVHDNLDTLNQEYNVRYGSSVLTYDIDKNLIQKKVYSDSLLTNLIQTKDFNYDIDNNLDSIIITEGTTSKTKTFTFSIDGDLESIITT